MTSFLSSSPQLRPLLPVLSSLLVLRRCLVRGLSRRPPLVPLSHATLSSRRTNAFARAPSRQRRAISIYKAAQHMCVICVCVTIYTHVPFAEMQLRPLFARRGVVCAVAVRSAWPYIHSYGMNVTPFDVTVCDVFAIAVTNCYTTPKKFWCFVRD
jgi:hypothetical protein